MSRLRSTVTACLVGLAVVGSAGSAAAAADPSLNKPSSWESEGVTCAKTEYPDGVGEIVLPAAPQGYAWTQVILKAGTQNTVLPASVDPDAAYAPANGKDISHAITCLTLDDGDGDGGGDWGDS